MEIIQKENDNSIEEEFSFEGNREDTTFAIHMIAGSIAGLMEHVAIFPIDTIKTHMQTARNKLNFGGTVKSLYNQGGFFRFWKGSVIIGTASVPAHSLYFSAYEILKEHLGVNESGFQFLGSALTGALATFVHDLILTPADVIKQRIQLSGSNKCMDCARNIIKTEGLFSFYRSLPITLLMGAPYSITTVMLNENLKKIVEPKKKRNPFVSYFFCAAVAGSIASLVTCPMDNIKTKLQTQNTVSTCEKLDSILKDLESQTNKNLENENKNKNVSFTGFSTKQKTDCHTEPQVKYKNIWQTVRMIWMEDGFVKGFFRGLTPRVMSTAPSCAVSWGTYEFVKHFLSKKKNS